MRIKSPLAACALLSLAGCVTQKPLIISPTTLGPEQEEVVGVVTGQTTVDYIPILSAYSAMGDDAAPLNAAIKNALAGKNAHALINVAVDRRCLFVPLPVFYFFARCRVSVTGTAVRYKNLKTKDFFEEISRKPTVAVPPSGEAGESAAQGAPKAEEQSPAGPRDQALYVETFTLYQDSLRKAAKHYVRLSDAERTAILEFTLRAKGAVSGRRRFLVKKSLPQKEKRFVLWLLSGRTKYRPIIR